MPARRTLRDGIVVGLIGYLAVAIFYSVFDVLATRGALYTVDMLGKAVFRGLRDPGVLLFPAQLDPMAIVLYNTLHLVLALVIGVVVTSLISYAEQHPARAYGVVFVVVAGFIVTIAIVGVLTDPMRPVLPWWSIVVANALASALAAAYLLVRRPGLLRRFVPLAA